MFERWHSIRKRFKWWLFWCWRLYEIHFSTCIHHECSILEFGRDSYQIVHNTSLIDCLTWVSTSCTYDSAVRLNTRLAIEKQIYRIQRKEYSLGEWITWKIVILKIIPNIQTFLLVKLVKLFGLIVVKLPLYRPFPWNHSSSFVDDPVLKPWFVISWSDLRLAFSTISFKTNYNDVEKMINVIDK